MSVTSYEENLKTLWRMYINLRSKVDPSIRVQKLLIGFPTQEKALAEEKIQLIELSRKLAQLELQGATWETVIDRWEEDKKKYPSGTYVATTIVDHASLLRRWTKDWLPKIASEINRGDGRQILRDAEAQGKAPNFLKKLKNTINVIYTWGIEERMIMGVHQSPVYGLDVGKDKEEKLPEILTINEIRSLLDAAKTHDHEWYPVWAAALLTGMRSGELHDLEWPDCEMVTEDEARAQEHLPSDKRRYGLIRVTKTWNTRFKKSGPTKGGYWRTVPISGELYWLLSDLKKTRGTEKHVLPRFWPWTKGEQARILRMFSEGAGLKSIKFHTLRACFATQLIADGVAPTKVMKVGGWKDMKTMQRYIRMAGIDEQGVTEGLKFVPSDDAVMGRVVNLYDFRAKR